MFLRNYWYVAAAAEELGRTLLQRWLLNEPVVLFRTEAGDAIALHDRCPHRSLPLSKGELIGDQIRCGYHGMTFDASGRCVAIPGYTKAPDGVCVRQYPLVERWGWLWIWMGDEADADDALIPDCHWVAEPDWTPCQGYIRMDAHVQLVVDNLLDLSHESFVHRNTIGNEAVAEAPIKTETKDGEVVVSRLMKNCPAPPLFAKVRNYTDNIDRHQYVHFTPPAFVNIDVRAYPAGTEDEDRGLVWRVLNALTPETETSTHYFWNVPRHFAPEDEITAILRKAVDDTFGEDNAVLSAQQEMLSHQPEYQQVNIRADAGGIQARRMVESLLQSEARNGSSRRAGAA